ncbi:NUP82 [Candida jiufengensis]|uniref:NUP82 n=1 Tax=Candida jiufengensis TaxID=497108 RepID=UPI0022242A54|nr:NUP82 [Candida jiufengensis]KAI5950252.1 NUP82 [Candida jiufengensis]
MSESLISSISKQSIFQHHTSIESSTFITKNKLISKNNLILRYDSEIYFAIDNMIRCCKINPITTNYKLIRTLQPQFEIFSLELNDSGNLLAVIGESEIEIIEIPLILNTKQKSIYIEGTTNKRIKLTNGKIKKVLWQSIIANDSMLVVLTDQSEILGYNIRKSTIIPLIQIKNNQKINSITFGSKSKISEGLKLYASTDDSILSFDFYTNSTSIAISENSLDVAIADTESIIDLIKQEFKNNTSLLRQAENQLQYYQDLQKNELSKNFREVRSIYSNDPLELFIIEHNRETPNYEPLIVANIGADDLISFGDNEQISLIATIKNNTISYFTKILDLNFIKIKQTPNNYLKPKKGFGFIDSQNDNNLEYKFYKENLNGLDFIQSETIPIAGKGFLKNLHKKEDKFVAVIESNLFTVNCEWVEKLLNDFKNNNEDCLSTIKPIYNLISSGDDLQGFAFVSQFDQEVAIVVRDNLEIVTIKNSINEYEEPESSNKTLAIEDKPSLPSLNLTSDQPFDEIENNLKALKKSIIIKPPGNLNPSIENLNKFNDITKHTNKNVTNFSIYAIKLQSRMISQLKSLNLQVDTLKTLSTNTQPYDEKLDSRISKIQQRQSRLNLKLQNLQTKLNDEFYKIKDIPISIEEKKYFEEINQCNKLTFELIEKLDSYEDQVLQLKTAKKQQATDKNNKDNKDGILEDLQINQKVKKLKNWLNSQDHEIHDLMDKVKIY